MGSCAPSFCPGREATAIAEMPSKAESASQKLGWAAVDADHDGSVTRAEYIAVYGEQNADQFDQADTSKDGLLTQEEYEIAKFDIKAKQQNAMRAGRAAPQRSDSYVTRPKRDESSALTADQILQQAKDDAFAGLNRKSPHMKMVEKASSLKAAADKVAKMESARKAFADLDAAQAAKRAKARADNAAQRQVRREEVETERQAKLQRAAEEQGEIRASAEKKKANKVKEKKEMMAMKASMHRDVDLAQKAQNREAKGPAPKKLTKAEQKQADKKAAEAANELSEFEPR